MARDMSSTFGWTGRILRIDLTGQKITEQPTAEYSRRFIGGLGIGEKIYWEETSPDTSAFDAQNPLIMMTGPLCGTTAPAAPRMVVCGKSPCTYPERFVNASIAGFFPAALKKAGFDGLVITGKAEAPVYLHIADGKASVHTAAHLWGMNNVVARKSIEQELSTSPQILSIGSGCENRVRIGNLIGDLGGSASMGFGSLMGSKNLKAIAVNGTKRITEAYPEGVRQVRDKLTQMTGQGFHNIYAQLVPMPGTETVKKLHCHACPQGCWRSVQRRVSGHEGIRKCHMGSWYAKWDIKLNGSITDATFLAADLANDYSLCTDEILFLLLWLEKCLERNILTEKLIGLPVARMGSLEFIQQLLEMIAKREGFGRVLAEGAMRAAASISNESAAIVSEFLTSSGRPARTYGPKSFIMSTPVFAVEQRPAITTLHEICQPFTKWALWLKTEGKASYVSTAVLRGIADRFWGGPEAVDFSTLEGKARAAKIIQDRQYAKECLVLCDLVWPVLDDASAEDHVGDPALESRLLSAVTGLDISQQELSCIGERVFNLNRAIQLRDGRKGRQDDVLSETCYVVRQEPPADIFDFYNPERLLPGKGDELLSFKMKAVDREHIRQLMDEYYALRGWDAHTGLLKNETLEKVFEAQELQAFCNTGKSLKRC
jgi:aldehyde:ferredoxin oxidoreductase